MKASGKNGRNPTLYNRYRVADEYEDSAEKHSNMINEIMAFHPRMKKDYYLKSIDKYQKDRESIIKINSCLTGLQEVNIYAQFDVVYSLVHRMLSNMSVIQSRAVKTAAGIESAYYVVNQEQMSIFSTFNDENREH